MRFKRVSDHNEPIDGQQRDDEVAGHSERVLAAQVQFALQMGHVLAVRHVVLLLIVIDVMTYDP